MVQMKFAIARSDEEDFSDALFDEGANSVAVENAPADDAVVLTAIFREMKTLREELAWRLTEVAELEESVWKYRWLEHLEGVALTDEVYVQPTTSSGLVPREYPYIILIDPRDAFGDGHHPTTALCADALSTITRSVPTERRAQMRVIDVGTGTGVLAVLAALLGYGRVDAIDIDPESVARARENFARNECARIGAACARVAEYAADAPYDIVIANLLSGIITDNIDHLRRLTAPGGTIIASGVSDQWHDEMTGLFRTHRLVVHRHYRKDGWNGYVVGA